MQVLNEAISDLKNLIDADLNGGTTDKNFDSRLQNWLHMKVRSIPQRPRPVKVSAEVELAAIQYPAIYEIENKFKIGGDLTPWLSKKASSPKSKPKDDALFNDWQIIHLHLSNIYATPNHKGRTGPLLFAHVTAREAILLDVLEHGSWTARSLLTILLQTAPHIMAMYEIKGVVGLSCSYNEQDLKARRKAGVSILHDIDGKVYASPGMGITTAGTALRLRRFQDEIITKIESVQNSIQTNEMSGPLCAFIMPLGVPIRLGIRYKAGRLKIYCKNRNRVIIESRPLE